MSDKEEVLALFEGGKIPSAEVLEELLLEEGEALFAAADETRKKSCGDMVQVRAILEFSNFCKCECLYCGLNAKNPSLERYRMEKSEIEDTVLEAWEAGYKTVVLQSGEDPFYTSGLLCDMIRGIKRRCGIKITLSVGERERGELRDFRQAGADRYLLKHETSDEKIYAALHPNGSFKKRITCLKNIKELGFETGSGFMLGLPGQSGRTVINDILLLKKLGCDMAGIGPFIPHPKTPLVNCPEGSPRLTRRAVALTRLILPKAHLPATTALGVLSKNERDDVFSSGANVMMKKVTPWKYRRLYEIYPSDLGEEKPIDKARGELESLIRGLGREPV